MNDRAAQSGGSERLGPSDRTRSRLSSIEHAALWIERPVRSSSGSSGLNPLPHAGTISVFLLGVVIVSGLYITLFFKFGHVASYEAVADMEAHAIQRVMRAIHRYASAMLALTTVIHGWRIFSANRFEPGIRRFKWVTGIAALVLIWLAGVTGYWLVWDLRAQALNEGTMNLLGAAGIGQRFSIRELSGLVAPQAQDLCWCCGSLIWPSPGSSVGSRFVTFVDRSSRGCRLDIGWH